MKAVCHEPPGHMVGQVLLYKFYDQRKFFNIVLSMPSDQHTSSNLTLYIVYANVILYATCYQLQRPLEPFMVENLVASKGSSASEEYANLQSFFQILQFFGSLIAGAMLDRIGFKVGFIFNFLASALSYYLLSYATTIEMLYISKIPSMFQFGFLCAQMAVSVVTADGETRAKVLGRLTTCYSVGMVVGPSLGGILGSTGDYYYGAKLAVVGSLMSVVLSMMLPNAPASVKKSVSNESIVDACNMSAYARVTHLLSLVWMLLGTKVITSVANSINSTVFPLVMKNTYHYDEKGLGFAMSLLSLVNGAVNAFLIGPFTALLGGSLGRVIEVSIAGLMFGSLAQSLLTQESILDSFFQLVAGRTGDDHGAAAYLACSLFLSGCQYLLGTTITAESTSVVPRADRGTLLGIEHALFSLARVSSPQIGIKTMNGYGIHVVSYLCAAVYGISMILWKGFAYEPNKGKVVENTTPIVNDENQRKEE